MEDNELRRIICSYIKEICHYSQMQVFATSFYQKNYFQLQIDEGINGLVNFFLEYRSSIEEEYQVYVTHQQSEQASEQASEQSSIEDEQPPNETTRSFTQEELASYNGEEGSPVYVAVNGIVYDVSDKVRWAGGNHFGLNAGQDVSEQFNRGCHQGMLNILSNVPKVGLLTE